ncbi:MAG: hypothetical protein ABSG95_08265 [Solirubrobacteraceae bacterium]
MQSVRVWVSDLPKLKSRGGPARTRRDGGLLGEAAADLLQDQALKAERLAEELSRLELA